jgi:predicted porin
MKNMTRFLYGTSALTTAAMIGTVSGNAAAAERIKVGIHGYHEQWGVYADQDYKNNALTGAQRSTNAVDEKHNSEICFVGETTLDNGLTFGINVQLEANTSGSQIDESYMYVQSDNLGQLILGDENNAGYLLHVTAPDGGISIDSGDMVSDDFWVNPGLNYFDRATANTYLRFRDNDSGKATYITPRFAGVQLGVSFIPQFESGGGDNNSNKIGPTGSTNNNINNGWAGGINYTQDFNGFGVQLSGGYLWGDNGADSVTGNDDDLNAYSVGAQFGYAGFSFGGAYAKGDGGGGANSKGTNTPSASGGTTLTNVQGTAAVTPYGRANSSSWTVGAAYEVGRYKVGIGYMKGEENPTANAGKGHLDQANISGTYHLGPGIRLVGGVFWFDGENEDNSQENKGWGLATGFKLGF